MYLSRRARQRNRGATLVESAVVLLVTFTLLFGLIVGGLGVSRYQAVAELAREATRAGSVRGGQYRLDHGLPAGTTSDWSADLYTDGVARFPSQAAMVNVREFGLDPNRLTYTCTWSKGYNGQPDNYATYVDANRDVHGNTLTVTVSYDWLPETIITGPITFSSTSQIAITY
jgi:hypothetical protein